MGSIVLLRGSLSGFDPHPRHAGDYLATIQVGGGRPVAVGVDVRDGPVAKDCARRFKSSTPLTLAASIEAEQAGPEGSWRIVAFACGDVDADPAEPLGEGEWDQHTKGWTSFHSDTAA